jgi:hypothetical protein
LDTAEATLTGTLGRCDSKASVLLGLTGAGLAVIISSAPALALPNPAIVIGAFGAATWVAAIVALLLTVRPHLRNNDRASWPYWSRLTPEDIRKQMAEDRRADRIKVLSVMARTKFTCLRFAVDLVLAGIGLLIAAAIVAVAL